MTPEELQTFLDALQLFLGTDFVLQLRDILSYMLGAASGMAFVIAASMRWHS
jgi:preprotein translocase subunit SecY